MTASNPTSKKVALFVCHDLTGLLMLNGIVPAMRAQGLTPVIFNTLRHRNKEFKVPTPPLVSAFNAALLEAVILPFLEENEALHLSYRQLAQKHGAEYHEIADVNAGDAVQRISDDAAIIGGMAMRFLQVFAPDTIRVLERRGFFWNLHSGLLGGYKGLLTPYRAIANGEKEYGVTLHGMAAEIDAGDIVASGALPLDPAKPVMDLYLDTVPVAVGLMAQALASVARGAFPQTTPQPRGGRYYSNPTAQELLSFARQGVFYADPVLTVQRIADAFAGAGTADNAALARRIAAFIGGALESSAPPVLRQEAG